MNAWFPRAVIQLLDRSNVVPRVSCVVVRFFQDDGACGIGHALPPDFDPEGLKLPHIQQQFAQMLAIGCSELTMAQIDWDKVIAKWSIESQK
jgi:hypothetical protein